MRDFFIQNETLILFADGVVFFALGFAVWLQRRRATRLTLTSSLIWFASFAFLEAVAIWGYVFVPIQRGYVDPGIVEGLIVLRGLVQTAALVFLVQFGLRLLPLSRHVLRGATAGSVALWALLVLGGAAVAGHAGWSVEVWEASVEAAARYGLLVPGALLSAIGLWRQREDLAAGGLRGIKPWAAAASAALAAYAVVGGLIVEATPWTPGGPLTADGWFDATGLPIVVVRGVLGLVMCVAAVQLLEIFEVEYHDRLEALERARLVAEERARFGRDLHDGAIQSIYAAGLRLEAAALHAEPGPLRGEIRSVVESLNDAITGIRGYINALRQPALTPQGLVAAMDELVREYSAETGLQARFRGTGLQDSGPLPDEAGDQLSQILREALSNAQRHAGPCRVEVALFLSPDELALTVRDDGVGVICDGSGEAPGTGEGLTNMRERARVLGGRLTVSPHPAGGTIVDVQIPLDSDIPASEPASARSEKASLI